MDTKISVSVVGGSLINYNLTSTESSAMRLHDAVPAQVTLTPERIERGLRLWPQPSHFFIHLHRHLEMHPRWCFTLSVRIAPASCPEAHRFNPLGAAPFPPRAPASQAGGIMRTLSSATAPGRSDSPDPAARVEAPTLKSLLSALHAHDPYTYRHSLRTVRLSLLLGRACGVSPPEMRALSLGAVVHDLGKVFIPGEVLHKEGRLNAEEWEAIRRHPADGARLLLGVSPRPGISRVVAEHHERWDGGGYPAGLCGLEIDFNARVVAVADAFDAMTSERPYRPAVGFDEAAAELERCAGTQFDPEVVLSFLRAPRVEVESVIGLHAHERGA